MRIISQTGCDFPYDQIVVMVDGESVKCKPASDFMGRHDLLGVYDTEDRAREVFNEIHDNYARLDTGSMVFVMPEE